MTRIDFYILPDRQTEAQDRYACTLAEDAFRQGHRVLIQVVDALHAERMDKLLWSYRDSSFIPHAQQGAGAPAPVEIGHGETAGGQHELLINISGAVPRFFSQFEQVSEIVVDQDTIKAQTREHYRYYKEHGYPLHHHTIRQRILSH